MKYILKEMSENELPRSKLKKFGVRALSDYELLAVIIKSGIKEKSVLDISIEIMNYFEKMTSLNECIIEELTKIKGIGEAKALELIACIELGRRIYLEKTKKTFIGNSIDAYNYIKSELVNLSQENFMCVYLDIKKNVISHKIISIGTNTQTIADLKTAFKWAIKYQCIGVIIAHNHPSGDPNPSTEDIVLTDDFIIKCKSLDIEYIDHIIIGSKCFYSFRNNKICFEKTS